MISELQLTQILPNAGQRAGVFVYGINAALNEFDISTPARQAAFLAQIGHESGSLRYVRELASGGAYEGREDLGNTEPGDGIRYKGRGLIQITGRSNYQAVGDALGIDALGHPELLEQPSYACRSAGWFWASRQLNQYADQNDEYGFYMVSIRINGRTKRTAIVAGEERRLPNGWEDRLTIWGRAKQVLGA